MANSDSDDDDREPIEITNKSNAWVEMITVSLTLLIVDSLHTIEPVSLAMRSKCWFSRNEMLSSVLVLV